MINPKNKLTVFHFDGASYSDYSRKAISFSRDSFTITLESDDYLYIGFDKPINSFFINLPTANTNDATFSLEYYNGNTLSWQNIDSFDDDSNAFQRNAFLQWDRNLDYDSEIQPDASMPTKFYYRLSTDTNLTATEIQGINILFSDDEDLKREFFCINDAEFLLGATSHILVHEACREEIVQMFSNSGFSIRNTVVGGRKQLIPWDLLEIQEIREGAKFLALHKIFFNLSDNPDDVYNQKSLYYRKRYEDNIKIALLSLDDDDDGIKDTYEASKQIKFDRMTR